MCKVTDFEPEDPVCKCRQAVLRAYCTLMGTGHDEKMAMDAAKRVYRHHHPEESAEVRNITVERWVATAVH